MHRASMERDNLLQGPPAVGAHKRRRLFRVYIKGKRMPGTNGFRRLLQSYLAPQWKQALLLLVLMLTGVTLDLANPQLIRRFIDSALAGEPINALLAIGATFLAVALLTQVTLVVEQYLAGNVAWRATNRLRADLTLHCLTLDLSYHGAHPPGELVERVDGDVAKLSEFFSQFLLLLLGILLLSFGIEWRVGLALTLFALFALVVLGSLRQVGTRAWEAHSRASAGLFGFLEEYLSGTEDLRANGATAFALRRLAEQQRTLLHTTQRAVLRGSTPYSATTILLSVGTAIGLLLGAYLYHAGTLTIGSVYLIFAYTELLRRPLEEIGRQVQQLQQASASVARIGELLAVQSRISDGAGQELPLGALPIAFEGVSFGYQDEPSTEVRELRAEELPHSVLSDVSFQLDLEVTLVCYDKSVVADMQQVMADYLRHAQPLRLDAWQAARS